MSMKFNTQTLTLYRDLCYTSDKSQNIVETESLWTYQCEVKHNDMQPKKELFLLNGQFMGYSIKNPNADTKDLSAIPEGKYLFLQGIIKDTTIDNFDLFLQASEELYLESLWLERKIKNTQVFLRFLEEDGKNVFQIFREIENT